MTRQPHLQLNKFTFEALFQPDSLAELDQQFLTYLQQQAPGLHKQLLIYRSQDTLSSRAISELIIACAPWLEHFIGELFSITDALEGARLATLSQSPIFAFKQWYVLKQARQQRRKGHDLTASTSFVYLNHWLDQALETAASQGVVDKALLVNDKELAVACLGQYYLKAPAEQAESIDMLTQWCIAAMSTDEGQQAVANWVSFTLPARCDPYQLIALENVPGDPLARRQIPASNRRQRDGFGLTDQRMPLRDVLNEVNYCIYCHEKEGDFCRKGFPQKKSDPTAGFKQNPLGELLTGCPVDEKISEMHVLKREGYTVGALATIMADNPMCPATGHRICNDCMKSCIYQKQDPVNIPQIETSVLTEVLKLPWGVEIYDLLTRWNPLRSTQWIAKPYNGFKVLVMGMGPAGFSLAYHLLMEGFAVVGADGLKIEPLPQAWIDKPIYAYNELVNALDKRIVNGFGGVAEYGITVRWDKNFLALIYLSLLRRPYFQVFGDVRFGGTLTVEDAWALGFDHLALAVGAGLPKALPMPGSLARGMRQANDFLMALQLTGAAKTDSLANFQVRLPAVVVGGGLTGVDTATEVQAYYLVQVEKTLHRYEKLVQAISETALRDRFSENELSVLDEMLAHGRELRQLRVQARKAGKAPDLISLVHAWGGVTIVYRRSLQESPAYRSNYEELAKALEEGIYYREALEPMETLIDDSGHVRELICYERYKDSDEQWRVTTHKVSLPARSIFIATGAAPNVAYTFEHRGTFSKELGQYKLFKETPGVGLTSVSSGDKHSPPLHCKSENIGHFTSYQNQRYRVSVLGDTHPVFHGSVVKAIASAKRTYPAIVNLFQSTRSAASIEGDHLSVDYAAFKEKLEGLFRAEVVSVKKCTDKLIELIVKAPLATWNFEPGHFYRVQSFESLAPLVKGTRLQTEALALVAARVDKAQGLIYFIVNAVGASSKLVGTWEPGKPVSLMGPTGVRNKIPTTPQTILLVSDELGVPQVCALGPALREAGHHVIVLLQLASEEDLYHREWIRAAADEFIIGDNKTWAGGLAVLDDNPVEVLARFGQTSPTVVNKIERVVVTGKGAFVKQFQSAFKGPLATYFKANPEIVGSVYGPMQCMLKGVCAQCLQWQIDPETGQRTKAVYACSWQDQPMQQVEYSHLSERLKQNTLQEKLTQAWLEWLHV